MWPNDARRLQRATRDNGAMPLFARPFIARPVFCLLLLLLALPGLAHAALPPMGLFVSGGSPALISPPGTFAVG